MSLVHALSDARSKEMLAGDLVSVLDCWQIRHKKTPLQVIQLSGDRHIGASAQEASVLIDSIPNQEGWQDFDW